MSVRKSSLAALIETLLLTVRTLVYMTGFVLLFWWIAFNVRVFDRDLGVTLPAGSSMVGVFLMGAGGILALACAGAFIAIGRGTPAVFDAPREFVARGPYRYVRNPMYIGGLILLVGFGFYERSVSILALAAALFLPVHLFVVYYEEPRLRKEFGARYENFCKTVPRWL